MAVEQPDPRSVTLTYAELRALLAPVIPHAGRDDMLPVLTMIAVATHDEHVVAQATDRFTAVFRRVAPRETPAPDFATLLPARQAQRLLSLLRPGRGSDDTTQVTLTLSGVGELQVTSRGAGFALGFTGLDLELPIGSGRWPDLGSLLPKADPGAHTIPAAGFHVEYLTRFRAALDVCDPDTRRADRALLFHMAHRQGKPLMVTVGDDPDFLGLVMPRGMQVARNRRPIDEVVPWIVSTWRGQVPQVQVHDGVPS